MEILPLSQLIMMTKLQFMHLFINNKLPEFTLEDWTRNEDRQVTQRRLRNFNEVFVPFARTAQTEKLPLTSFPKIWTEFEQNDLKLVRSKIEFKIKFKQFFLDQLLENYKCERLLCPHCTLTT